MPGRSLCCSRFRDKDENCSEERVEKANLNKKSKDEKNEEAFRCGNQAQPKLLSRRWMIFDKKYIAIKSMRRFDAAVDIYSDKCKRTLVFEKDWDYDSSDWMQWAADSPLNSFNSSNSSNASNTSNTPNIPNTTVNNATSTNKGKDMHILFFSKDGKHHKCIHLKACTPYKWKMFSHETAIKKRPKKSTQTNDNQNNSEGKNANENEKEEHDITSFSPATTDIRETIELEYVSLEVLDCSEHGGGDACFARTIQQMPQNEQLEKDPLKTHRLLFTHKEKVKEKGKEKEKDNGWPSGSLLDNLQLKELALYSGESGCSLILKKPWDEDGGPSPLSTLIMNDANTCKANKQTVQLSYQVPASLQNKTAAFTIDPHITINGALALEFYVKNGYEHIALVSASFPADNKNVSDASKSSSANRRRQSNMVDFSGCWAGSVQDETITNLTLPDSFYLEACRKRCFFIDNGAQGYDVYQDESCAMLNNLVPDGRFKIGTLNVPQDGTPGTFMFSNEEKPGVATISPTQISVTYASESYSFTWILKPVKPSSTSRQKRGGEQRNWFWQSDAAKTANNNQPSQNVQTNQTNQTKDASHSIIIDINKQQTSVTTMATTSFASCEDNEKARFLAQRDWVKKMLGLQTNTNAAQNNGTSASSKRMQPVVFPLHPNEPGRSLFVVHL